MNSSVNFVVVLLLLLGVAAFVFYGSNIKSLEGVHSFLFGKGERIVSDDSGRNIVMPNEGVVTGDNGWCVVQEKPVGESMEDPIRDRIIGWDTLDQCCVRHVEGYSCALNRMAYVRTCITADVGGQLVYVSVDGYYGDKEKHAVFVGDLDKEPIHNKVCSTEHYPEPLK